jgi:hypothetical protein
MWDIFKRKAAPDTLYEEQNTVVVDSDQLYWIAIIFVDDSNLAGVEKRVSEAMATVIDNGGVVFSCTSTIILGSWIELGIKLAPVEPDTQTILPALKTLAQHSRGAYGYWPGRPVRVGDAMHLRIGIILKSFDKALQQVFALEKGSFVELSRPVACD